MKLFFFSSVLCAILLAQNVQSFRTFKNPVIEYVDNPDPGVLFYNGFYYAVTTTNGGAAKPNKFRLYRSTELQVWSQVAYVFTKSNLPNWTSVEQEFWAPELHIINGQFRVYFTSRDKVSGVLSIGVGTSNSVIGPYTALERPIVQSPTIGSIDPTVLKVQDINYLVWKEDGNGHEPKLPTTIWAQRMSDDGLSLLGERIDLLNNTLPWEGDLVEGPWFVSRGEYFYLFYSGNDTCTDKYSVGVARSRSPLGPYEKKGDPILVSDADWKGPGHCSVVKDIFQNEEFVMVYHAWKKDHVCGNNNRLMNARTLSWSDDDWPFFA